jgi:uncharacterized membrane protein YozB (DUF420 family)
MMGPDDWPSVNASLNATSAVLLVIGYTAIKNRLIRLHVGCMLGALTVSTAFLACYLYYHIAVRHGQPTVYPGAGGFRVLYFGILISHTVLAAVAAPLALFTAYQAIKGRFERHIKIARWTFPIWLYVSLTGVIVYLMLYWR